jgi:hypothetical protein
MDKNAKYLLDGDVEGVEEFLKTHSNYGPLFCAWERIKKELRVVVQKPALLPPSTRTDIFDDYTT